MLRNAKLFLAALFATTLVNVASAQAGCWTSQAGCNGRAYFRNTTPNLPLCIRVHFVYGGQRNFCLGPGQTEVQEARTGDNYCYWYRNQHLPANCTRNWMWIP
jgi:hypothetical protein